MTALERNINNNKIATYLGYVVDHIDSSNRTHWGVINDSIKYYVGREDELKFDLSYDALLPVIVHIHNTYYKQDIEGRTLLYTIKNLLGGGYKFDSGEKVPELEFSVENLYSRVVLFIDWYNNITQKGRFSL